MFCYTEMLIIESFADVIDRIREGDPLRSLREVERLVTQAYVNKVLGS